MAILLLRKFVKSGVPVTVYYAQDGDRMVASKVIVHHVTIAVRGRDDHQEDHDHHDDHAGAVVARVAIHQARLLFARHARRTFPKL